MSCCAHCTSFYSPILPPLPPSLRSLLPHPTQGDCTRVTSIDDRKDFATVQKALSIMGFSEEEATVGILRTLAAIVPLVLYVCFSSPCCRPCGVFWRRFCTWAAWTIRMMPKATPRPETPPSPKPLPRFGNIE